MLPGIAAPAALSLVERQGEALKARFAARRDNVADMDRLREAASRITDTESLLRDRRTLRVVLEAFGLESEIDRRATLRRVLTEDPADRSSLVNRLPDPRWRQFAEAFAGARRVNLSAEALAATPPEELARLERNRIAGLDFLQIGALTAQQVAALDPARIGAIAPDAIGGLNAANVAALSAEQVAAITPAQSRALLAWQVAAIEPRDIPALSAGAVRALTPGQIGMFSPAQVGALTPDQLRAFGAVGAGAFSDEQLAALTDEGRAILRAAPFLPPEDPAPPARRPLDDPALLDRVIDAAMTQRFERAMGEASPGLREALYFRRMAGGVTTIPQLMSDRALLEVARGALGLPQSFAALTFEQQRDLLTRRLDVAKLKDPAEVGRMAARYVATLAPAPPQNPALALFGGGGATLPELATRRISFAL